MSRHIRWFDAREMCHKKPELPFVTISFTNTRRLYVSSRASENLVKGYVRIGHEPENMTLILRPSDESPNAFRIYRGGTHSVYIHASGVVSTVQTLLERKGVGFNLDGERFYAEWNTSLGALVVHLDQPM